MFISFWAFKGNNDGATIAAGRECQAIYSRLSAGKAGTGLWALSGSAIGHYGFHLATKTGQENAALRNAFGGDSEATAWRLAYQGQFEFVSHDLNRRVMQVTSTSMKEVGFLSHWRFIPDSPEVLMESASEAGKLWQQAGCESAALFGVQGSGVGQFAFETHFADEESFGKVTDALNDDPAWAVWQKKYWGTGEWHSNVMAGRIL